VLRNDTSFDDTYTPGDDVVVNLAFPECAVAVLTPDAADLPLALTTIDILYASGNGGHLGDLVYADVGLELVPTGGVPTGNTFDWGPETFALTVANNALNELDLDDAYSGWTALWMTEGSVRGPRVHARPRVGGSVADGDRRHGGHQLARPGQLDVHVRRLLRDRGPRDSWLVDHPRRHGDRRWRQRAAGGNGDGGGGDDSGQATDGPTIDSVVPDSTSEGTAEPVAVIGAGLSGVTAIYFGGLPGSALTVSSDTTVEVTSPSGLPVGVHDVMAELDDGSTATFPSAFTVSAEQDMATGEQDIATASSDDGGCGCATHGRSLGWLAIALGAALVRRGRH
jgi:hypothetical protein